MFNSSSSFGGGGSSGGGFGGFNQASNTTATRTGFGAFGQSNNTGNTFGNTGGAFGQSNTTGGFGNTPGGFGQASGSGTTGFGQSAATGFGQRTAGTAATTGASSGMSTFGQSAAGGFGQQTGGGMFGQSSAGGGGFGGAAVTSTFGGALGNTNTGTGHTPFKEHIERNPTGAKEAYQNICAMNEYMNFSPEELRLQDYLANRKQPGAAGASGFGNTGTTGFGQTSAAGGFGSTGTAGFGQTSAAGGGGFGQTNTATGFGQTSNAPAFGQANTSTTGFGANTFGQSNTGGGFGQATNTGGGFGQNNATTGFGANTGFGAATNKPAFGQSTATGFGQTSTSGGFGGGAFGAAANKPAFGQTSGTGFGQTSTATTGFGGGTFGSSAAPAATGFGAATTAGFAQPGTTGFGQTPNTGFGQTSTAGTGLTFGAAANKPTFGGFGQTNTSAPATSGGLFGASAGTTGGFGQTNTSTGGGLFGSNTNAGNAGGGLFGSNTNTGTTGGGLFGNKPATSVAGGGLFGSNANTATNTGGGLFGSNTNTGTTGGGLFGTSSTNAATNTGGSLFGANSANMGNTGGGLFGTNNTATSTGGGLLFGNKPATGATGGGLFGPSNTASTNTGGGLFGSSTNTGGGLFGGSKPAFGQAAAGTAGGGLFGSSTNTGGGLFGGMQNQQQTPSMQQPLQLGQLSAQIDKQPYGTSSLFDTTKLTGKTGLFTKTGSSHLTATPLRSSIVEQSTVEKERELKKRGLSLHSISSPQTATSSRLRSRGFAAPTTAKRSSLGISAAGISSPSVATAHVPAITGSSADNSRREPVALFGRDGFLSPAPQTPRSSVKRLVINRKPGESGFTAASSSPVAAAVAAVPAEPASPWTGVKRTQSMAADPEESPAAVVSAPKVVSQAEAESDAESDAENDDGEYWMVPNLAELRSMPEQKLRAVKEFVVGRNGVGQVRFMEPVDLTSVGSLGSIAGGVVLFDDRVCTVYPDETNKPPRGQGLNVPAIISLDDCWPSDRSTGKLITKVDDVRVRKHIRRLKKAEDTEFISFIDGTWVFRVEHFSRYGLEDDMYDDDDDGDDDDDDDDYVMVKAGEENKKQGFSKATAASAVGAQGHMGGSRAVAQSQPKEESISSDGDADADMDMESGGVSSSGEQGMAATQQLPASRGRAPAMRASLFPKKTSGMDMGRTIDGHAAGSFGQSAKHGQDDGGESQQRPSEALARNGFDRAEPQAANPFVLRAKLAPRQGRRARGFGSRDNMSGVTSATGAPSLAAPSIDALDLPSPSKYLRTSEPRIVRDLLAQPQPYSASVTHGRSGVGADAGMMMARSFRVSFGPQGQLVYLQSGGSKAKGGASTALVIDSLSRHIHAVPGKSSTIAQSTAADGSDAILETQRQMHMSLIRAQWEHAHIEWSAATACPAVTFRDGTTIASVVGALSGIDSDASKAIPQEESRILELAAVLFDELAPEENEDELTSEQLARIRTVRRRQALTRWLMSAVHESVQSDLVHAGESASPSASSVFALLSGNKIESACLSAISHRDYRLATLVSQCGSGAVGGGGSDTQFQEFVRTQLHRLEEVGDSKTFPSSYRRVYELLSGNVEWEASQLPRSSSSGCFVSRGLDWKRAFGVTLWYAQAPADPIAGAVRQYERMFKEGSLSSGTAVPSPIAPPLPSWLFADGGLSQRTSALAEFEQADSHLAKRAAALSRSSVWDAAFQLLKLFSEPTMPLEKALVSESFTAARGDSRLATIVAWLLNAVRQCRGFEDARQVAGGKLISLAYDSMLAGWAFQLETLGLWQWSCYLLLQLSSDLHKTHAIRALLDRSLTSSSPSSALVPAAASGLLPESSLGAGDVGSIEQQVRFVRNDLRLPELWLYESYANRSRYDRQLIEAHSGTQQLAFLTGRRAQTSSPAVVAAPPLFNPGIFAGSQLAQFASPLATVALDSAAVAVLREVAWLISARRLSSAHLLVMQKIAPDAVLRGDYRLLSKVLSYLDPAVTSPDGSGTCVPGESWMCGGQVYKSFLAAVEDLPAILKQLAAAKQIDEQSSTVQQLAEQVKQIYSQMATLLSSLPSLSARFEAFSKSMDASLGFYDGTEVFWYSAREARELRIKYSVAISEMAAVVTGQVQQLESCFPGLVSSSSSSHASPLHQQTAIPAMLPLAEDMRILRTYQMAQTCFESLVADELEA